jgi:DNA-binding transcriptional ArsR family regulator
MGPFWPGIRPPDPSASPSPWRHRTKFAADSPLEGDGLRRAAYAPIIAATREDAMTVQIGISRRRALAILAKLRRLGPMTINALAADMVMDRTTLGRNILPLERDGLIAIEKGAAIAGARPCG